jgi:hypothetical protein
MIQNWKNKTQIKVCCVVAVACLAVCVVKVVADRNAKARAGQFRYDALLRTVHALNAYHDIFGTYPNRTGEGVAKCGWRWDIRNLFEGKMDVDDDDTRHPFFSDSATNEIIVSLHYKNGVWDSDGRILSQLRKPVFVFTANRSLRWQDPGDLIVGLKLEREGDVKLSDVNQSESSELAVGFSDGSVMVLSGQEILQACRNISRE